jgi:hypothetical protein
VPALRKRSLYRVPHKGAGFKGVSLWVPDGAAVFLEEYKMRKRNI